MVLSEIGKEAVRTYLINSDLITVKEVTQVFEPIEHKGFHNVYSFRTNKSSFILKQIKRGAMGFALPKESYLQELRFYELIKSYDYLARFMPQLYLVDVENELIVLEEVPDASNFNSIYKSHHINLEELQQLVKWLNHLHRVRLQPKEKAILEQPLLKDFHKKILFDFVTDRLQNQDHPFVAEINSLNNSSRTLSIIHELEQLYKEGGFTLLHGNYSPGNWLLSDGSVYIIDPKSSVFGKPEMDIGNLLAHFLYASINPSKIEAAFAYYEDDTIDRHLAFRFAGLEMIRSIIGVYPTSIPGTITHKKNKLKEAIQLLNG